MSYINDALRKAQKEKKSYNVSYSHIISTPERKLYGPQKLLLLIGTLLVFFSVAGIMVLLYWPEDKKVQETPLAMKPLPVQDKANMLPAEAQVVKETITVTNNKAGLKRKTISAETKLKPVITDSKALYTQALQKQQEGKIEEAQSLYKKVIKIDRLNVQALNNLGVTYMSQRNYKKAITCFHNALNIKHDYVEAHYNLACLYAQKNDVPQSLFYLKNAIEFNPQARQWAKSDSDLKVLADLLEFKNLVEKPEN
ncbi:MAG: tetratricopeptide repeat protein [Smithellaceae bacterium]|jgi:tetratricopeptide (TPR) repeat protein